MHPRRRQAVPPLIVLALCITAPVQAAKPMPTPITLPVDSGQPRAVPSATCLLGVLGPPVAAFGYVLPEDDVYYTLLRPSACLCPQGELRLGLAHMLLYFTEPCEVPVTVSITPAFETAPGCFTPNPFSPPVCPPVQYTINDGGVLNTCQEVALPFAPECCIREPVFLTIEFDRGSCRTGRPAFCSPATCTNCVQYNFYPGAGFPGDDLCVVLSGAGLRGTVMFAESDCCAPTPTLPTSWGGLKLLYR